MGRKKTGVEGVRTTVVTSPYRGWGIGLSFVIRLPNPALKEELFSECKTVPLRMSPPSWEQSSEELVYGLGRVAKQRGDHKPQPIKQDWGTDFIGPQMMRRHFTVPMLF